MASLKHSQHLLSESNVHKVRFTLCKSQQLFFSVIDQISLK